MRLIGLKICPFLQRVRGVLEVKGVPYTLEYLPPGERPEWFKKLSPHGLVPLLIVDRDRVLFESTAISEFVDEALGDGHLHPVDPFLRARHRAWSELAAGLYRDHSLWFRSVDEAAFDKAGAPILADFAKMERALTEEADDDGPFFAGASLSMIDVAWAVPLIRTRLIEERTGLSLLASMPRLDAWAHALANVDALMRALPDDFERVFEKAYLNEGTYLGQAQRRRTTDPPMPEDPLRGCC